MKPLVFLDTETYINYHLTAFTRLDNGKSFAAEVFENDAPYPAATVRRILHDCTVISFNGMHYDAPILAMVLAGAKNEIIKKASDDIIEHGMRSWEFEREYGVTIPRFDHIDLMEPTPGVQISLKLYAARMHSKRLQDLPLEPSAVLTREQASLLRDYCMNSDIPATNDLWARVQDRIALRERMSAEMGYDHDGRYRVDLRSKSDAQVAEAIIKERVQKITGWKVTKPEIAPGTSFKYVVPPYIRYETLECMSMLGHVEASDFVVAPSGKVLMPDALKALKIRIGKGVYKLGIGGVHSTEKGEANEVEQFGSEGESEAHTTDADTIICDRDVTSYYPRIILGSKLSPKQMGGAFLSVYNDIVVSRVAAKKRAQEIGKLLKSPALDPAVAKRLKLELAEAKTTEASLKIAINGSFGKFGSKYSTLYAPHLMIQTTITGQLALLMLIEQFELRGISVLSANTDGVVFKHRRDQQATVDGIVRWWEQHTGFETEDTLYRALYSRDVNNYIAIKTNGEVKTKGIFADPGLMKNPCNFVCSMAVIAYLTEGTPVEETVRGCRDIRQFLTVRKVAGGAKWDYDLSLVGKVVRWYYSSELRGTGLMLRYAKNGNKVSRSEGGKPLMVLPDEFPLDVDYQWYIDESYAMLKAVGVKL